MGLTNNSMGKNILRKDFTNSNNKKIALIGNPNVGKSTVFNALTNLNQHTGNWTGKTVDLAYGKLKYNMNTYTIIDLPGTYSLSSNSKEEELSRDFISFNDVDLIVIILDSTMLERNLNLTYQILQTNCNVLICLNLNDEALKKKIYIDDLKLFNILKVPIIKLNANNKKNIDSLIKLIIKNVNKNSNNTRIIYKDKIESLINKVKINLDKYNKSVKNRFFAIKLLENNKDYNELVYKYLNLSENKKNSINNILSICNSYININNIDYEYEITSTIINNSNYTFNKVCNKKEYKIPKIDKLLTSRLFGPLIMILFLIVILWITIIGANFPSKILAILLSKLNDIFLNILTTIKVPYIIIDFIINGILKTLFWVISVMLPPMAIFFPLFTLLEDVGFLPRIAFNLDKLFKKAKCHGKQSLSMCMGFGCNACGVVGARIIDTPKERLLAIITNSLVPCNGRFPSLIAIITMFFAMNNSIKSSLILFLLITLSVIVTLITSRLLSSKILKGTKSAFILEMPSFRKPNIKKIIIRSIFDRILFVLGRAIIIAIPAGIIIWCLSNICIDNISILTIITQKMNPIAKIFGLDGVILIAFILGFPANEIVIPIIIMAYLKTNTLTDYNNLVELKTLLTQNGWTIKTAICTLVFILFHFPCSTTILTIKKETKSNFWTFISFITPLIIGLGLCFTINMIFNFIN